MTNWRTGGIAMTARRAARRLGCASLVARWLNGSGYERRYDSALSATVSAGDVVWDVGANVGHYTRLFAELVGPTGVVIAFEPSPQNFRRLEGATSDCRNVKAINAGLGDRDGRLAFMQGEDELGATSRVVEVRGAADTVEVLQAHGLVVQGVVPCPNVVKIDVEGFELEVLSGFATLLSDPRVRCIGVEVHFGILDQRGLPNAPARIEAELRKHGFEVEWPDLSHLVARRPR